MGSCTITIYFYDNLCDKKLAKTPQKPNYESKKIRVLEENGVTSKLKHRKARNSILSGGFGYPYGRLVGTALTPR